MVVLQNRWHKISEDPCKAHLQKFPSGKFNCDCANYHSLNLCSRAVAATEINGRLAPFVEWYKKFKKSPSVTKLLIKDVPKGYGQKGGKNLPKRRK